MEISEFDPMIVWFDRALEKDFCKDVIKKFNKDERSAPGVTAGGYSPDVKQSLDLQISRFEDWKEVDDVLFECLNERIKEYDSYLQETWGVTCSLDIDTGYQIQKTKPGGFYHWHHDFNTRTVTSYRTLTYIWYLNTPRGGNTEFSCGESIKPETGKLLLFPATWDRVHRGTPPKTIKYLCTGWMHAVDEQDLEQEDDPKQ